MPTIQYDHWTWRPRADALAKIDLANEIIESYMARGFKLTLRQIYYQFVTRNAIPNEEKAYKNLGKLISKARLAGMIDWDAIEDRTRALRAHAAWKDGGEYLMPDGFRSDRWANQPTYVEVWVEKQALEGVFWQVCEDLEVPLFSAKGYPSQSEMWRTAQRLIRKRESGHDNVVVLHFGDHDPSGMDMTRDLEDRWSIFEAEGVEVRRLALNMDQVEQYNPQPNPTKFTDPRSATYTAEFGDESWELDALEPEVLHGLVRDELDEMIDPEAWAETNDYDREQIEILRLVQDNFEDVAEFVRGL